MRVEKRTFANGQEEKAKLLILVSENKEESELIDEVMGSKVGDNGFIAVCVGEVRLSDGYAEHYISLEPAHQILPAQSQPTGESTIIKSGSERNR